MVGYVYSKLGMSDSNGRIVVALGLWIVGLHHITDGATQQERSDLSAAVWAWHGWTSLCLVDKEGILGWVERENTESQLTVFLCHLLSTALLFLVFAHILFEYEVFYAKIFLLLIKTWSYWNIYFDTGFLFNQHVITDLL